MSFSFLFISFLLFVIAFHSAARTRSRPARPAQVRPGPGCWLPGRPAGIAFHCFSFPFHCFSLLFIAFRLLFIASLFLTAFHNYFSAFLNFFIPFDAVQNAVRARPGLAKTAQARSSPGCQLPGLRAGMAFHCPSLLFQDFIAAYSFFIVGCCL